VIIYINPTAPYKALTITEEDNLDTDRDKGVLKQLTVPTPPMPLVSKFYLPQLAKTVQPVLLYNEKYS
jgi:hypothetical protein